MKPIPFISFVLVALAFQLRADQSVTLAWDPNPEPDVSSYVVYYGTGPRIYPLSTNVGNVTTATVYGLGEGRTYYFAITAKNTTGLESDFSNEVTNAIPATSTNTPPRIWPIGNVVMSQNQTTNITIEIWDVETNPSNLVVTATATNRSMLPSIPISFLTNGHSREVSLNPIGSGTNLVVVTVSDGEKASSTSFVLSVIGLPKAPEIWFQTFVRVGPSRTGPWQWVNVDALPIKMDSNLFYRIW